MPAKLYDTCLPPRPYLYAYCMCITEDLAVVAVMMPYRSSSLFPSVPLVLMSGILMPKMCLGAYSILVLFFVFFFNIKKYRYILVYSTFIPPKAEEPKKCLHWKNIKVRFF